MPNILHWLVFEIVSLEVTRFFLFNKSKLTSFPTAQSLSIVVLPRAFAMLSFSCLSCWSCTLCSLDAVSSIKALKALSKNCRFQLPIDLAVILYLVASSAAVCSSFISSNTIFAFCSGLYV